MNPIRIGAVARGAYFALLPAAAVAGALALAPLIALAGVASFRVEPVRVLTRGSATAPFALLAAFLAWALVSSAWSINSDHSQALRLALTAGPGLLFAVAAAYDQRLTRAAGLAAFTVLAAILGVEAAGDMPLNRAAQPDGITWMVERNPARGVVVLLSLSWAAAAMLLQRGQRELAACALALAGVLSLQFSQLANFAGFAMGLGCFVGALMAPRTTLVVVCGGLALWLMAAPFASRLLIPDGDLSAALPFSWAERMAVWEYVSARILEAPWTGYGLDASRAIDDSITIGAAQRAAIPLHPHSASLQIWFETGAIGAALAAATLVLTGRSLARAFKANRAAAAAAAASLASLGFIANVSYGLWQEWWIATLITAGALVGCVAQPRNGDSA